MIDLSSVSLQEMTIHYIGNKTRDERIYLSKKVSRSFEPLLEESFVEYFTKPFEKVVEFYNFFHPSGIAFNELNSFCASYFNGTDGFGSLAEKIGSTLYEKSVHPNINGGELFITSFKGANFDHEPVEAIGIFKSELKETFIKLSQQEEGYEFALDAGINIREMDKGCIVLNTTKEKGQLTVCVVDNTNRSKEAKFWTDGFLQLISCQDDFHSTKDYLDVAKKFVTEKMPEVYELSKADKIDYLNKSINYFKKNDHFAEEDFLENVFQHGEVIDKFNEFKAQYTSTHDMVLDNSFEISDQAVKKQARVFKSILKLDRNFHIYIHGNKELIERGTDADGRKYYKIYYEKEA